MDYRPPHPVFFLNPKRLRSRNGSRNAGRLEPLILRPGGTFYFEDLPTEKGANFTLRTTKSGLPFLCFLVHLCAGVYVCEGRMGRRMIV